MHTKQLDHMIEQLSTHLDSMHSKDKLLQSRNIFIPALILLALHSGKEHRRIQNICDTLIAHILENKNDAWTWNYWPRSTGKKTSASERPSYPDDMDDTSCAIAAIALWRPEMLSGEAFANITKALIACETQPGGPYFTWIGGMRASQTPDIGVNANISFMLSLIGVSMPELTESIDHELRLEQPASQFYSNRMMILYFISRNYSGKEKSRLIEKICTEGKSNLMDAALAASSLIRLDAPDGIISEHIAKLGSFTVSIGKSEAHPMYIEKIANGIIQYATSEAFTAAAALEALLLCRLRLQEKTEKGRRDIEAAAENQIQLAIIEKLHSETKSLSSEMKAAFDAHLEKFRSASHWNEIALLPYSLVRNFPDADAVAAVVGAVGVLGWIAYTIDDMSMDEPMSGHGKEIPLSRFIHRKIEHLIRAELLPAAAEGTRSRIERYIGKVFIDLDNAHHAEILGKKVSMTEKSFGHALPVMLIAHVFSKNIRNGDAEQSVCENLLKMLEMSCSHYILARQLSDDAHDWQEDMNSGRLTDVTEMMQRAANAPMTAFAPENAEKSMRDIFWNECALRIADRILEHAMNAKQLAEKCSILDERFDMSFLIRCISRYEAIGRSMTEDIRKTKEFLAAY